MNHCGIQQKNTFASTCEEMRNVVTVCPKPRRLSLFNGPINEPVRPLRLHMCYQPEPYESKASRELLEIIFEKPCTQAASSPPYFCGSPPSRVSNPLTQDTQFGSGKSSLSSSERKVGPVGGNFGNKPAVRIEGFECLARDTRRGIPARA